MQRFIGTMVSKMQQAMLPIAVLILAVVYSAKAYLLFGGTIESVLMTFAYDDAFYYFEIARHIALGQGPTFDGVSTTNGFHPLWLLMLLPIFHFSHGVGAIEPVFLVLGMSFFFDAAALILLGFLLHKVSQSTTATSVGLLLWALNPYNFFGIPNGLETALVSFLLIGFSYLLMNEFHRRKSKLFILGTVAGFMMLARTDYVIFAATPFILWILFDRNGPGIRDLLLEYMGTASIVVSPWLAWSYYHFGTVVQTSGLAFTEIQKQLIAYANPNWNPIILFIKAGYGDLAQSIPEIMNRLVVSTPLFFLFGYCISQEAKFEKYSVRERMLLQVLISLSLAFIAFTVLQIGIRNSFRVWYFVPLASLFPILWMSFFLRNERASVSLNIRTASGLTQILVIGFMALTMCSMYVWTWWSEFRGTVIPSHQGFIAAYSWINEHYSDSVRIGVLNAGIVGYFTKPTVINLDGLVNKDAYEAIRQKNLMKYVHETDIRYIVDWEGAIQEKFRVAWGVSPLDSYLTKVRELKIVDGRTMTVYEVK